MYPNRSKQAARTGSVLIVGVGALGCASAMALARAPLSRLTLVDPDRVEPSNLQRQVLFCDGDVGSLKVEVAAARLAAGGVQVEGLPARVDDTNAAALAASHDFVIDACDDPATKFLINRACVTALRPFTYGGVTRTSGRALAVVPGVTACLACVFGEAAAAIDSTADGCADQGIVAPVAGVIGSLQAHQALGALGHEKIGRPGRLFAYELGGRRWRIIETRRDARCAVCGGLRGEAHERSKAGRTHSCRS